MWGFALALTLVLGAAKSKALFGKMDFYQHRVCGPVQVTSCSEQSILQVYL